MRIVIAQGITRDMMKVSRTIVTKVGVEDVTLGAVKGVGMIGMTVNPKMTTASIKMTTTNHKKTQGNRTSVQI